MRTAGELEDQTGGEIEDNPKVPSDLIKTVGELEAQPGGEGIPKVVGAIAGGKEP